MMANLFQMNIASTSGPGSLPSNTVANPKGELKAITTQSGLVLDGHTIPPPSLFINPKKDERIEKTLTNQNLSEYTIKVPPPLVQKSKPPELKCKALADLGASINLMPLSIWKKLGLPDLISTRMTLELANRAICTPAGIARDIFVLVGKFTFLVDFIIVDYKSDPRVPLILGIPFLRTARALIDVHGEEMILRDGDERLTLNMRHDTSSYSNHPQKESINLINVFNNSSEDFLEDLFSTKQPSGNPTFHSHPGLTSSEVKNNIFNPEGGNVLPEKLLDLDSTKDLYPPLHVNPLSGSTTYFSSPNQFLEEFTDELALIRFLSEYNDDLTFDIESDFKEIEYLLYPDHIKDIDSSLKDLIDQSNLDDLNDNLVDSMPEMFTDEHALDYSSPSIFDEYDDDLFEVESDTENVYDDHFDSKGEKIKEVDASSSTNNEENVLNLGILTQENPFETITRVVQDKKLAISNAFLMLEDFDPPVYEPLFFKEVPRSTMLLPFSSKNEEKVFKPGIHTSKKVRSSLIPELSHQGYKVFKINQIFKIPMKIFLFSCGKDTHILAVPCHHFYLLD
uniref:Reverse transcriptase domain-containing protein n=1 Tax=Tanacetum cinerariifolium TaxID=118510 RepID=A0A6L2K2X4_TANCI|nr:reverse transcriptase domain-containing protein [Tanacetum cinerariifolium]